MQMPTQTFPIATAARVAWRVRSVPARHGRQRALQPPRGARPHGQVGALHRRARGGFPDDGDEHDTGAIVQADHG
eukprot:9794268-Alexandrium_andersonii.AAC.1